MFQSLICSTEGVKEIQTLLTSTYAKFRLQSICLLIRNLRICEGMFPLEDNLQKVVVMRRMIFADILVFFKALAQLFCLRFTIETFCHYLELCDCQNSLAPRRRLSLFLSIIGKEDDTFYGYRQASSKVGKCQQVMKT